ncbi:MAG: amidohydrolase [Halieaceae bacterium]
MRNLTIALLQQELAWEDPAANREQFGASIAGLDSDTDLVILPEMFTTGFSMNAEEVAEDGATSTLPWLQELASSHDVAITGSLAVREGGEVFNRLLFVTPDGQYQHYDKRHRFRMSGEDKHYGAGADKLIVQWRDWRICPMICYDLRFPVWTRNRPTDHTEAYDALIFVANWPAKRRQHWRQLLIARAIENQAYCIGLNRVGSDGNGLDYSGDSLVLAADGELLLDCEDQPGIFSATLDAQRMQTYRDKFPCHKDADEFRLEPE